VIFAKIDFINLLPFYIFIKKNLPSLQAKQIINYKKSYPSKINKSFKKRAVDGAFISSIISQKSKCLDIGIVAKKEVFSVLIIEGKMKIDYQSDTSNALAKVLKLKGEVLIGDKALLFYHQHKNTKDFKDLSYEWNQKYHLPFVFARLCINKKLPTLEKVAKRFVQSKVFIPQYILKEYELKTNIHTQQIKEYLTKISYSIGHKEKLALKKFFILSKESLKTHKNN